MKKDDYEKVRRIVERSKAVETKRKQDAAHQPVSLALGCAAECAFFWYAEFPKQTGVSEVTTLDLSGSDLQDSVFAGAMVNSLKGASFQNAMLDRSRWYWIDISEADFSRANLHGCQMVDVAAIGAVFRHADLSKSRIVLSRSCRRGEPLDLAGANLEGATIENIGGIPLVLNGARMKGCRLIYDVRKRRSLNRLLAGLSEGQRAGVVPEERVVSRGRCFIATAACGSDQHEHVVVLREFRDVVLRRSWAGRQAISLYELTSPVVAWLILHSPWAQRLVSRWMIYPLANWATRQLNREK